MASGMKTAIGIPMRKCRLVASGMKTAIGIRMRKCRLMAMLKFRPSETRTVIHPAVCREQLQHLATRSQRESAGRIWMVRRIHRGSRVAEEIVIANQVPMCNVQVPHLLMM